MPHKNVPALLRAFSALPGVLCRKYQIVLAGTTDEWVKEHLALCDTLGIENIVRFIGQVKEEDMPGLYSGADLFVFPSLCEGFGLPPLEAMACGTAVVASNRTSIPEVVGDAGVLVDPEDISAVAAAMRKILEDDTVRANLEERGLNRASHFRVGDICGRQMQLLEEVGSRSQG